MRIPYAYLKQQTWLYRRNYPRALQPLLGQALKQSLKTGDAKVAKVRAAEINATFEDIVAKAKLGIVEETPFTPVEAPVFTKVSPVIGRAKVTDLGRDYLNERSDQLRHGGFKSVRFSVGLLVSLVGSRPIASLTRDDGQAFVRLVGQLSRHVGKSERHRGLGLEGLVDRSEGPTITPQTQRRILSQVVHFLDWCVYRGQVQTNPFKTVRVEQRGKVASYVAPTDDEVRRLLALGDPVIGDVLLFCLLSGLRAGEAAGLLRSDLAAKGNLDVEHEGHASGPETEAFQGVVRRVLEQVNDPVALPEGKLDRFADLNRRAIQPSIAEINQLSRLTLTATPNKIGRTVASVTISWQVKEDPRAAKQELARPKVGRIARREGTVEAQVRAFPACGSIAYDAHWMGLKQAARCNMDNGLIADKFRAWCRDKGIALNAPSIEKAFRNFCAKVGKV